MSWRASGSARGTLADTLKPHAADMAAFADKGSARLSRSLARLWAAIFPMVLPPDTDDGLGFIVLNSNAETHFSFTNALGLVSAEQARAFGTGHRTISTRLLDRGAAPPRHRISPAGKGTVRTHRDGPHQRQLVHPSAAASGRSRCDHAWPSACRLDRRVRGTPDRIRAFPGHGGDRSPETYFYVHTFSIGTKRRLRMLEPERITLCGRQAE